MAILPSSGGAGRADRVPVIVYRLSRFGSMDFEMAAWQLAYLCIAPKRVYRNVYFHKQTKNTWARDDPAIFYLVALSLTVAAYAWAAGYFRQPWSGLGIALFMIIRDYLVVSIIMATILQLISNKLLLSPPSHTTPADSCVEWAYAFDVHTNAFFPFFLTLYVVQLFLAPVILRDRWVCLFVGNTLYLAAFAQYIFGVYLGLNALPFLTRTELLLAPLAVILMSYFISLLGFNVAKGVLTTYWDSTMNLHIGYSP